jgi:hypothetical protein
MRAQALRQMTAAGGLVATILGEIVPADLLQAVVDSSANSACGFLIVSDAGFC